MTFANVAAAGQNIGAGKKMAGRKRHVGVDTLGLLLAVWVTAASVSDDTGGIHLLSQIAVTNPPVTRLLSGPSADSCTTAGSPLTTKHVTATSWTRPNVVCGPGVTCAACTR
ncbi:hypothetical protein GCM10010251_27450 [Streptomyces aurantiogriseus]|uniref:Transposase IS4-like domain-containing protein n=1 Tax=Streptomyces aurantiogriseus TaxID=66870 RepID=A0A918C8F8_9ACTN|nr:hypothetical protein GCM10010251_27450 [Streptomyces aurantiogriseus]